jgi:peptide/bleomycin uptake transporter
MLRAFYRSKKWAAWAYGGGALLIASLWIQVQITVAINTWYGGFYNLLQTAAEYKDKQAEGIALFYDKLISISYVTSGFEGEPSFAVLAFPYVILAVLQTMALLQIHW